MVCSTDSGMCKPSRLLKHGAEHDTIGSILSNSVNKIKIHTVLLGLRMLPPQYTITSHQFKENKR